MEYYGCTVYMAASIPGLAPSLVRVNLQCRALESCFDLIQAGITGDLQNILGWGPWLNFVDAARGT